MIRQDQELKPTEIASAVAGFLSRKSRPDSSSDSRLRCSAELTPEYSGDVTRSEIRGLDVVVGFGE